MGAKFHIDGAVTLSTKAVYVYVSAVLTLVLPENITLRIKTPIGADGEDVDVITITSIDPVPTPPLTSNFTLSDDGARWTHNFVPYRSGTHYYNFKYTGGIAADEENFKVETTQFA